MSVVIEEVVAEVAPENQTRGAGGQQGSGGASSRDAVKKMTAELPCELRRLADRAARLRAD
jgi:hypothetical protein